MDEELEVEETPVTVTVEVPTEETEEIEAGETPEESELVPWQDMIKLNLEATQSLVALSSLNREMQTQTNTNLESLIMRETAATQEILRAAETLLQEMRTQMDSLTLRISEIPPINQNASAEDQPEAAIVEAENLPQTEKPRPKRRTL